jgi:hypothetical protein
MTSEVRLRWRGAMMTSLVPGSIPAAAADAGRAGIGGDLEVAAAGLEPATRGL